MKGDSIVLKDFAVKTIRKYMRRGVWSRSLENAAEYSISEARRLGFKGTYEQWKEKLAWADGQEQGRRKRVET